MSRRVGLPSLRMFSIGVLASFGADAVAGGADAERRPNVIIVLIDDLGYGDLACHGNPVVRTPNLDRLYAEGIRFADFHVFPFCTPTRAALNFSRSPMRVNSWSTARGRCLPQAGLTSMAEVFRGAGYRTGLFGKWHLGENYPFRPQDRGFDEVVLTYNNTGGACGYFGNDCFDDYYRHNGSWRRYPGYNTDVLFEEAMKFMRAAGDRPFFVHLAPNAAHWPFIVPERCARPYRSAGLDDETTAFLGAVSNVDENLGRLEEMLAKSGLRQNTLLLFLGDNGAYGGGKLYNAGMRGVKGSSYDGGHRVACFLRWPAGSLAGGRDVAQLTSCLDLLPTLMGLCNIPAPSAAEFEGLDLSGLLRGTAKTPASRKLIIHAVQGNPPPPMWKSSCVLQDQWRLVEGTELYDIAHDPGQNENVARQHPQLVRSLREHYEQWYQQVSEHFDDDPPIVLGSDHENPTALTYDNLHHHARFYHDERAVREGVAVDGHWVVEVSQAGVYEISLRRWPAEAGLPLCASLAADTRRDGFLGTPSRFTAGKALPIAKARLRIADVDQTRKVAASGRAAIFRVHLPKGKTTLKAWFLDGKDQYLGAAYYAYVQRRSDRH